MTNKKVQKTSDRRHAINRVLVWVVAGLIVAAVGYIAEFDPQTTVREFTPVLLVGFLTSCLTLTLFLLLARVLFGADLNSLYRSNDSDDMQFNRGQFDFWVLTLTFMSFRLMSKFKSIFNIPILVFVAIREFFGGASRQLAIDTGTPFENAKNVEVIAEVITVVLTALLLIWLSRKWAISLICRFIPCRAVKARTGGDSSPGQSE